MAFTDEFAEALGELEDPDLVPATMTWAGSDYPCFGSGATKGGKVESFGFGVDEDLVIIVRGALFGSGDRPLKGQTLTFSDNGQSGTFSIDKVLTSTGSAFLRLACVNASRGA